MKRIQFSQQKAVEAAKNQGITTLAELHRRLSDKGFIWSYQSFYSQLTGRSKHTRFEFVAALAAVLQVSFTALCETVSEE